MNQVNFLNVEYFLEKIYNFFAGLSVPQWLQWAVPFLERLRPYAVILELLFLVGIVYSLMRIHQIEEDQEEVLYTHEHHHDPLLGGPARAPNPKWERILAHIESQNPSDWRLAILEADIMLDEMLDGMGYHAQTLGDKLKSIERSDFTNIDRAWEAHNVRNAIAHEGSEFLLNQREARRVTALYQVAFEEFKFV